MLRHRCKAFQTFFKLQSSSRTSIRIQSKDIQTSKGGKYKAFTDYLNQKGILHHISYPKIYEQDGLAERMHHNITKTGLFY